MDEKTILKGILDSYPYPIVFVDNDYIIRYLNRYAQYHYYQERGYRDLIEKVCLTVTIGRCPGSGSKWPIKK